jgi:hypothetical protein
LSKGFEDCYTAWYDRLDRENAERSGIASGKEEEYSFRMFVVRAGSPERKNQDDGSKSNTHDDTL